MEKFREAGSISDTSGMLSLWFRPSTDGPSDQSQTLYCERDMGDILIVWVVGTKVEVYLLDAGKEKSFSIEAKSSLLDGKYHHFLLMLDKANQRCRMALDGNVNYSTMSYGFPKVASLNTEYIYWGTYSYGDMVHRYSVFGAMPQDAHWGQDENYQNRYPMINFYQGDLDEFISWADPDVKTDGEFEQVVSWLWNSGNGYFYPGVKGTVTDSYTPSVGDTGIVLSGIFIPTGPTLANAIAKLSSTPETENPNQTTDEPIISSIDSDKFNTSHGTEYIDAWVGPIELVCHGEKSKLNYKCTHTANATEGEPSSTTVLHELLVNKCTLLYTEGTGTSRVWCGSASMTTTSTTYDPESGSFTQTTDDKKVLDAVLAWDDGEQKWKITLTQTEPTGPGTGFEPKTCSGTMYLYGDLPITNKWSGGRYDSTDASEYTWITDDFTTYMVDTTTEANG